MTRAIALFVLALCLGACTHASCSAPRFRTGAVLADTSTELIMNISIPLQDFSPAKLVCLSLNLKAHYENRRSIIVSIFSSHKAASNSLGVWPVEETKGALDLLAQMHAQYTFDSGRHVDKLEIIPMPTISSSLSVRKLYDTEINFPLSAATQCRLEIDHRCVIALENIYYPNKEGGRYRPEGTVIMSGKVTRNGTIKDVQVVHASINPNADKGPLVEAALANLKTWQLETANHEDSLRITYSYQIDKSYASKGGVHLQFDLPEKITVEGSPQ